jgi:hypothetical protein
MIELVNCLLHKFEPFLPELTLVILLVNPLYNPPGLVILCVAVVSDLLKLNSYVVFYFVEVLLVILAQLYKCGVDCFHQSFALHQS